MKTILSSLVIAATSVVLLCALENTALAGGRGLTMVPEIDPSSAASALAVLTGCGLMLSERFRRR